MFLRLDQAATPFNARTDQAFVSRQELIEYAKSGGNLGGFTVNALQYLGTFSREGIVGAPQWSPAFPDSINPNFQKLWVTGLFIRNDGTSASNGDYLVNKRFLLQRLNWLTYRGPSAARTIPASAPAVGSADYDMWLLTRTAGITLGLTGTFLQQGTDLSQVGQTGATANIYKVLWVGLGHYEPTLELYWSSRFTQCGFAVGNVYSRNQYFNWHARTRFFRAFASWHSKQLYRRLFFS